MKLGRAQRAAGTFSPWRTDFAMAGLFAAMGSFALWRGVTSGSPSTFGLAAGVAVVMALSARWAWKNGRRRWYGKELEVWAVERAGRLLDRKRITWEAGRFVPGIGDVDLVVESKRGLVAVEIKSFNRWEQSFWRRGAREADTLAQAARAAHAVGAASALVWLPRGRATLLQRVFGAGGGGVRVVFGDERALLRKVRKPNLGREFANNQKAG